MLKNALYKSLARNKKDAIIIIISRSSPRKGAFDDAITFVAVCFLAFSNGANGNFEGVASLYGSGAASYKIALAWATLTTLSGSLCVLFLAQTLLIKFSGKGLAPDALIHSSPFITAVAAGAGMTVILATHLGFPVSTTHALLGALTGSSLLAAEAVKLSALSTSFILPLLLSPLMAVILAVLICAVFQRLKVMGNLVCLCVENKPTVVTSCLIDNSGVLQIGQNALPSLLLDNQAECASRYVGVISGFEPQKLMDALHFLSAGEVCFARGLNDTPKITALLLLVPGLALQGKIVIIA